VKTKTREGQHNAHNQLCALCHSSSSSLVEGEVRRRLSSVEGEQ
jgi:hypothetical protein